MSVHSIKKAEYGRRMAKGASIAHVSLFDHFVNVYSEPTSARFLRAQRNFIKSLAGYSVATYLLQIKDRHNGNILIDREGHVIHIDFGFMLSNSPGNMGFEAAPFKLTMVRVAVQSCLETFADPSLLLDVCRSTSTSWAGSTLQVSRCTRSCSRRGSRPHGNTRTRSSVRPLQSRSHPSTLAY